MLYRWFVRKQALVLWDRLSDQRFEDIPIANDVHFVYLGDHPLATELRGADAMRSWLRNELFRRLPGLRFEVEEILVEGGPWSTRMATRYAAKRDGKLVYRGVEFTASLGASSSKNESCLTRRRFLPDSNDEAGAGPVNR